MLIGHVRIMRRAHRRSMTDTAVFENSRRRVSELLKVVDALTF